jgi:hypothetical protein
MNNRIGNIEASQLRAEARYAPTGSLKAQSVQSTPGGLVRSTLIAGVAAGAILVFFWLPAEYGIDPTGIGTMIGLTEMGEIKQQLAAEAEADAVVPAPSDRSATPIITSSELLARLDQIDAQLAAIATVIGAPMSLPETPPEAEGTSVLVPETTAANAEPVEAAVPQGTTPEWRDEVSYSLAPGEGIEVKLAMEAGQTASFSWTANGSVVNFDLHGDGGGQSISYEQGRAVGEQEGELVATFTGNHGWFWRNRTEAPVTVTLRTGGDYLELRAP